MYSGLRDVPYMRMDERLYARERLRIAAAGHLQDTPGYFLYEPREEHGHPGEPEIVVAVESDQNLGERRPNLILLGQSALEPAFSTSQR
jgi:hypothetical protein